MFRSINHSFKSGRLTFILVVVLLMLIGCAAPSPSMQSGVNQAAQNTDRPAAVNFATESSLDVPLEEIAQDFHFRAADLIAAKAGTESASEWRPGYTTLGPIVRPFLRPDVEGPAYWEFEVLVDGRPAGFILLSTGHHDHPVSSWASEGMRISDYLLARGDVATLYKLDSLFYVGESAKGEFVSWLGAMPPKIDGMDLSALDKPQITEISFEAADQNADDPRQGGEGAQTHNLNIVGSNADLYKLSGWESWDALKQGYVGSYGVLLEGLRREAKNDWQIVDLINTDGTGIPLRMTYALPLLDARAKVDLGDAARFVEVVTDTTSPFPMLLLTGKEPGAFQINISYPDGEALSLNFFVFDATRVPEIQALQTSARVDGYMKPMMDTSYGSVIYKSTGGGNDLRDYWQFKVVVEPVFGGECWTGCGATAWAMLFGWADYQASIGNSYWKNRWGIYRTNGGYGSNSVAPASMTYGIEKVTKEIRGYIGTWCALPFSDAGATYPARMADARHYLEGRTQTDLYVNRNDAGVQEAGLRDVAVNAIKNTGTPAIIGTGWLSHYPMAYAYRYNWYYSDANGYKEYAREFKVIQGWGDEDNPGNRVWIPADTWFAGRIKP